MNRRDIFWDHANPAFNAQPASDNDPSTPTPQNARFNTDGRGFWIHLTDDVQAEDKILPEEDIEKILNN